MSHQRDRDADGETDSDRRRDGRPADRRTTGEAMSQWLAESALRIGLTFIGFVLLVYALGRAVGINLLDIVADAFLSPVGRWLVVAFFALVLILVALRGFESRV